MEWLEARRRQDRPCRLWTSRHSRMRRSGGWRAVSTSPTTPSSAPERGARDAHPRRAAGRQLHRRRRRTRRHAHREGSQARDGRKSLLIGRWSSTTSAAPPNLFRDKITVRLPRERGGDRAADSRARGGRSRRAAGPLQVADGRARRDRHAARGARGVALGRRGRAAGPLARLQGRGEDGARAVGACAPSVFEAVLGLLAREDRTPERKVFQGFGGDRFRTAITRACTAAGVPAFLRTISGTAGSASCTWAACRGRDRRARRAKETSPSQPNTYSPRPGRRRRARLLRNCSDSLGRGPAGAYPGAHPDLEKHDPFAGVFDSYQAHV